MTHELAVFNNFDEDFLMRLCDIQLYCSSLKSTHRNGIYVYLSQIVVSSFVNYNKIISSTALVFIQIQKCSAHYNILYCNVHYE